MTRLSLKQNGIWFLRSVEKVKKVNQWQPNQLKPAILKPHDTLTGPNDIHYQVLQKLIEVTFMILLNPLNSIWNSGISPEIWEDAVINTCTNSM